MKNLFTKTLNATARFSSFIIIAIFMVLYLMFAVLQVEGDLVIFLSDPKNILWICLNTGITIALHQIIITTASDNATTFGLETEEFKLADRLNGEIINTIGANFDSFIDFIRDLNEYEKRTLQQSFIQSCGKKKLEDLDKKELKAFKKLKPVVHDITNFLRPCYAEVNKHGKISYDSSYIINHRQWFKRSSRIVFSVLMAVITLGPILFKIGNFGEALLNAAMTSIGVSITFITVFVPIFYKLKYTLPRKVFNKGVLVNTYKEKNGILKLELEKYQVLEPLASQGQTKPLMVENVEKQVKEEIADGKQINSETKIPTP